MPTRPGSARGERPAPVAEGPLRLAARRSRRGAGREVAVSMVTLYTKRGCHLCEEALAVIERVRAEVPFELRQCEITEEERIHRAYFDRIPVVEVDGEEVFQYTVSEAGLREALARARAGPAPVGRASRATR